MRSLFHFPLPCTTTLAVTVSYSNRPTAPEMSRRPHPAPMRRQRRSPVLLSAARPLPGPALTGPRPTVARSQGARHAAPPSLPRAAARSHRAPSPEYRPAAARSHWARLVRIAPTACRRPHRIYPTACRHPHPPMSPPSRFRAHRPPITTIVRRRRLTRVALRRPHRAHRAPTSASPSRVASAPGPGWQEPRRMHPFFAECAKKASFLAASARNACFSRSRWQHPRPMHPFPGAWGDSGYMARESCRQGPFSASRSPKSRMARRCCQRRPAFPRQRHAVRRNGLCAMRRGPGLLAACAPCHLACARRRPRSSPPSYTRRASPPASRPPRAAIRRAAHCGRGEPPIGLFLPPSCCPRRCISPPARRIHPARRADPPRPGNKRNSTNNSMRA